MAAAIAPTPEHPLRPEKPKAKVNSRRARLMLSAELGWLAGYPTDPSPEGLGWQLLRPGATPSAARVDRDRLHQANWALRKIYRDFLPVLPQVLAEPPEAWRARTRALLDALVPCAQAGAAAPDPWLLPKLRARAEALDLAPLTRAVGWRWASDPAVAQQLLTQLELSPERWSALLARPGGLLTAMVLLGWMTEERPERVLPTLSLLIEPADAIRSWARHRKFVFHLAEFLDSPAEAPEYPSPAAFDWSVRLQELVLELNALPKAGRRRALQTLAALRPPLATFQAWWLRFGELERQVFELPRPLTAITSRSPPHHWRDSVRGRVRQFQANAPAPWHPREVLDAVRAIARDEGTGQTLRDALPILEKIPREHALSAFLVSWTQVPESGRRLRHMQRWLRSLRHAAHTDRLAHWALPWQTELERWQSAKGSPNAISSFPCYVEPDGTLDEEPEHAFVRFYDWLDAAPRHIVTAEASRLASIFTVTDDFELAERLLATTPKGWISDSDLRARAKIAAYWPDERLRELKEAAGSELTLLASALSHLHALGHGSRLSRLPRAELTELAGALLLLESHGVAPPQHWQLDQDAAWLDEAPQELRPVLADLNLYRVDARGWASRAVEAMCPSDEALDREIAALELRAPPGDNPMSRRLSTLRARRATTRTLSLAQLRRLIERAQHNADQAFAARMQERMRESVSERLPELVGIDSPPEWLNRVEIWRVLLSFSDVGPSVRSLAFRLLRERSGPPPWDLREEPANRAFLDRLVAQGVRTAPWLAERRVRLPGSERIELSFEADPLEIFQMGSHFDTCLSPGETNYFSAVVNAADINKRVVYARGPDGQVLGRALLALTDEGNVLTYTPYCHRPELEFHKHIAAFAATLSEEMGTAVLGDGKPRTLLAGRWYDDCARDLSDIDEVLGLTSPLVLSLETLPPEELLPALRAALRPAQLAGQALSRLVALDVVRRRPQLLAPLVPGYLSSPSVAPITRLAAAAILATSGELALARPLLPGNHELRRGDVCCGYTNFLEEILSLDPWFVFRVLRHRGPHSFSADDGWARARALEAVGRPVQALRAYREAIALVRGSPPDWVAESRARLAELERRRAELRR